MIISYKFRRIDLIFYTHIKSIINIIKKSEMNLDNKLYIYLIMTCQM